MSDDPVSVSRIRFETEANLAGAQQAERALDGVARKAQESGAKTADAGKAGAVGMQTLGQTAAAASGSIGGVSSALGGLSRALPGLQQATVYAGAAGAAFAAWKRVIDELEAAARKMREALRASEDEQLTNAVGRRANAYSRLVKEMDAAAAARKALSQAEEEAARAEAGFAKAKLESEREAAKARLAPDDEMGRRQIDQQYGAQISGVEAGMRAGSVQRKREGIRAEQEYERTRQQEAFDMRGSTEASIRDELGRFQDLTAQQSAKVDAAGKHIPTLLPGTFLGTVASGMKKKAKSNAGQEFEPSIKDSLARQADLAAQMKAANETIKETEQRLAVLELNMDAARMEENAIPLDAARERSIQQQAAGKLNFDQTAARKSADAAAAREKAEAERKRIIAEREDAQGRMGEFDAAVDRERTDVAAAERTLAGRPRGRIGHDAAKAALEQQIEELNAREAAREKYDEYLTRFLTQSRQREEALVEQMKRQ